jgi:hypothetical protein
VTTNANQAGSSISTQAVEQGAIARDELVHYLTIACALLEVETNAYDFGHETDRDKRKAIARSLRSFTNKARSKIALLTHLEQRASTEEQRGTEGSR